MDTSSIAVSSKPRESRRTVSDRKAEATNKAAIEIIDAEMASRKRKTARLRAMRIEKEEADKIAEKPRKARQRLTGRRGSKA